jgi:chorismate--pyruvate lyase
MPPSSHWLTQPLNSGRYRSWLLEGGSLTQRLQLASASFEVKPLQSSGRPLPEEARLLKLGPKQKALVREVFLCCNGKPAVFAHSVLPFASLQGAWKGLTRLGSKPLGAALFSNPKVERTPLEFKKLSANHPLYKASQQHMGLIAEELWARRSVFFLGASAILVTEVFLPQVLTL